MKKIAEDIKRYEDELLCAKILMKSIKSTILIQMAKEDLDLKTLCTKQNWKNIVRSGRICNIKSKFYTLKCNWIIPDCNWIVLFSPKRCLRKAECQLQNLVDSIDPGEEPLTGEMIHQEFLRPEPKNNGFNPIC